MWPSGKARAGNGKSAPCEPKRTSHLWRPRCLQSVRSTRGKRRALHPVLATGAPIVAQYGYAPSGMLTKLDEVGGATPKPIWEIKQAFQGHLVQREDFGNGAISTYGYDADRHWRNDQATTVGASTPQELEYKHFHNGRIQFRIDDVSQSQREHVYDDVNRLSSVVDGPAVRPRKAPSQRRASNKISPPPRLLVNSSERSAMAAWRGSMAHRGPPTPAR